MKVQFHGRVIGHELVEGDKPKSDGEGMKVKLALRAVQALPGKSSTGTLQLPTEVALREFPLKRVLLISIEEGQKELWDAVVGEDERPARRKDHAQGEIGLPCGDSPVAHPPTSALGIVPGRRVGNRRRPGAPGETAQ